MYLIFDCETNGLPKKRNSNNINDWPRIVSLSWGIYKECGDCILIKDYIAYPEFQIQQSVADIHGITTRKAQLKGIKIKKILEEFTNDLGDVKYLVAHNIDFDYKVILFELLRNNINYEINLPKICTMKSTTNLCKLKSNFKKNEYKWPKLEELYFKLFNVKPENMHNSKFDVIATAKCFFELKKLKENKIND